MPARATLAAPAVTPSLPPVGMSRWQTLQHIIPVSREKWRQLCLAGRAPAPVRISERCTMYPNAEVYRWLADPVAYRKVQEVA